MSSLSLDTEMAIDSTPPVDDSMHLTSADKIRFRISRADALESGLIKTALESDPEAREVPLQIPTPLVDLVVQFLVLYSQNGKVHTKPERATITKDTVLCSPWGNDWVRGLKGKKLLDATAAANYMAIQPMLELTCARFVSKLKGTGADPQKMKIALES